MKKRIPNPGCRTAQMQDRMDAGQVGCLIVIGQIQDRFRTEQIQARTDSGQDRIRTGQIPDQADSGQDRFSACMGT